jgi:hypothetical protein
MAFFDPQIHSPFDCSAGSDQAHGAGAKMEEEKKPEVTEPPKPVENTFLIPL